MLHKVLAGFPGLATEVEVRRFEVSGRTYALVASARLKDGSRLYIREYLFRDGTFKYSYHWQDPNGTLLGRWDNEPHWPGISSFPHHHHTRTGDVEQSYVRGLGDVLMAIQGQLPGP